MLSERKNPFLSGYSSSKLFGQFGGGYGPPGDEKAKFNYSYGLEKDKFGAGGLFSGGPKYDEFGDPQPQLSRAEGEMHKPKRIDRLEKEREIQQQKELLPLERKLVMREYKKVYIFCLSGNINGLRTLFKYNKFATDKVLKK